jgi:uncharacterized damage-inducible protein DinB
MLSPRRYPRSSRRRQGVRRTTMHDLLSSTWAQVRSGLLATFDKFSDDELSFRPAANGYSVGETLLHIANEEDGEVRFGITRELSEFPQGFDAQQYRDKSALIAVLGEVHNHTLTYLHGLNDDDLAAMVETPWGATNRRVELLWHVIEHEIHHRGELSLMLGLLGREGLDA